MKTIVKFAVLAGVSALAVSQASANLIVNGNFQAGYAGFTSDYLSDATHGIGTDAGTYDVVNNPFGPPPPQNNNVPPGYFDHTFGTTAGLMLAVNGGTDATARAWDQTVTGLTVGQTYKFDYFLSNWSFDPVANVAVKIDGVSQVGGVLAPETAGVWKEHSFLWTAGATSADFSFVDLQTNPNGNDFALDDISLVAVPEASTMIAGALLLLPFGLSALRSLRKNAPAA